MYSLQVPTPLSVSFEVENSTVHEKGKVEVESIVAKVGKDLDVDISFPPMKYCTDNAAMIAAAGYYAYLDGRRADLTLNSKSQDTLK